MSIIGDFLSGGLGMIVKPIADVFTKRIERKEARDTINGQLAAAKQTDETTIVVNDQHLEAILAQATTTTWKDEYVTLSVVGIINAVMLGGILQGFGQPHFLEGVIVGIQALSVTLGQNGGDLGWILKATVMAAIGLNVWRKV